MVIYTIIYNSYELNVVKCVGELATLATYVIRRYERFATYLDWRKIFPSIIFTHKHFRSIESGEIKEVVLGFDMTSRSLRIIDTK